MLIPLNIGHDNISLFQIKSHACRNYPKFFVFHRFPLKKPLDTEKEQFWDMRLDLKQHYTNTHISIQTYIVKLATFKTAA